MNYLALTLSLLLLAVGSQAAHLPSMTAEDVPAYMEQLREAMNQRLALGKQRIGTALEGVISPEHSAQIRSLSQMALATIQEKLQGTQEAVQTVSDAALTTVKEATAEMQEAIMAEMDDLKLQLDPHLEKAQEVARSHLDQYQTIVGPIAEEYQRRGEAEMAALEARLAPVWENLKEQVPRNMGETKVAFIPIWESLKSRGGTLLETAKEHVGPYVSAYKADIKNLIRKTRQKGSLITDEEWTALRQKVTAHGQSIAESLMEIKRDIFG